MHVTPVPMKEKQHIISDINDKCVCSYLYLSACREKVKIFTKINDVSAVAFSKQRENIYMRKRKKNS